MTPVVGNPRLDLYTRMKPKDDIPRAPKSTQSASRELDFLMMILKKDAQRTLKRSYSEVGNFDFYQQRHSSHLKRRPTGGFASRMRHRFSDSPKARGATAGTFSSEEEEKTSLLHAVKLAPQPPSAEIHVGETSTSEGVAPS